LLDSLLQEKRINMVLKTVDFSQFLHDNSGIPFDVDFEVIEEVFDEFTNVKLELDRKKVKAHKTFLSAASPVFKSLFYGKMKADRNYFAIKDTRIKAFELFIQSIYGAENLKMDIKDMFEIMDLADFYIIDEIKVKMIDAIKKEITFENLKTVADAASTYIHDEGLARNLLKNCGKFLQTNLGSKDQISEFLQDELMEPELIKRLLNIKCENCDYFECKDNLLATFPEHEPLRQGVKVTKCVQTEKLDCSVAEVILGPVPNNVRPNTRIVGSVMVLNVSDGSQMTLPVKKMTNQEDNHWYTSKLRGVNFLSTGGLVFRCKGDNLQVKPSANKTHPYSKSGNIFKTERRMRSHF